MSSLCFAQGGWFWSPFLWELETDTTFQVGKVRNGTMSYIYNVNMTTLFLGWRKGLSV